MRLLVAVAAVVALATTASCGDETGRVAEGYCGQIELHLDALNAPQIDDGADIERTIEMYRTITSAAPAAIEPEWQQLLATHETASTVDADDPASVQRVADAARSTRPAATRVQQYTDRTCAMRISDPPPVTNPVTATLPPDATPPGGTPIDAPMATPPPTAQSGG